MSDAISLHLNKVKQSQAAPTIQSDRLKAASFLDAPNIGEEGTIWRRLTTTPGRELIPIEQDRMIEIAYWLWQTNPLAGWLINITTSFIIAEGLPYEAKNPDVKAVLDGFWNDSVNRLPLSFPKHIDELHIFGELCLPAFTAVQTGRVRLGYIDPAQIKDVITDPENVQVPIGVLTKGWAGEVGGYSVNAPARAYKTILPEGSEYVLSKAAQYLRSQFTDGECHYWSINNVSNSPRGRSTYLPVADWLDAYEQFLYDYAEKWPQLNAFVWDILVTGGGEKEIKEQLTNFSKKSGSAFGHNEKVVLSAITPDLKSVDAQVGARVFRNHIMGSFGYPEHWYGGGGDVNRATASEMDTPALKMLSRKQMQVKYIVVDMLSHQVRQARAAQYLKVTDDDAAQFSVTMPPMETKDIGKLSAAVQQLATSLTIAEQQQWVDKDTARKIFAAITNFTGVDINLDTVAENIKTQEETKGYEDYLKGTPGVSDAGVEKPAQGKSE